MKATIVKAPNKVPQNYKFKIFLAGSIDMGAAENWQARLEQELSHLDIVICNPRRDDWDSSWTQSINDPKFNEQVTWELDNIASADMVLFYFDPKGQAPITLMELGYAIGKHKFCYVCCPDGFWRKGNVEMICHRNNVMWLNDIEKFIRLSKYAITQNIANSYIKD